MATSDDTPPEPRPRPDTSPCSPPSYPGGSFETDPGCDGITQEEVAHILEEFLARIDAELAKINRDRRRLEWVRRWTLVIPVLECFQVVWLIMQGLTWDGPSYQTFLTLGLVTTGLILLSLLILGILWLHVYCWFDPVLNRLGRRTRKE